VIARMIEHSMFFSPEATKEDITRVCNEARQFNFAAVCVNSVYVPLCAQLLKDSGIGIIAGISFPFGAMLPEVKTFEAERALAAGATELEMIFHVGAFKDDDTSAIHHEISAIIAECQLKGAGSTVSLPLPYLDETETIVACRIAHHAGADYVKLSPDSVKIQHVRAALGNTIAVKVSHCHDLAQARQFAEMGVVRIETTNGVQIAREETNS
jgi:deoxyribose-phosphate aldolase